MLKPLFYNRDFTLNPFQPASWLKVDSARWSAKGGPDVAQLSGPSNRIDLARILSMFRCPVELIHDTGMPAWWGYVGAVEYSSGKAEGPAGSRGITIKSDLDQMTNRIKVRYMTLPLQANQWTSVQIETAWADNLLSQSIYGVKEKIIHLQDSTELQAAGFSQLTLNNNGWPIALPHAVVETQDFASDETQNLASLHAAPRVVFTLRGWWSTLGWKYYSQAKGLIENLYEGPGTQEVGSTSTTNNDMNVYQSFTVESGDWIPLQVWLKVAKKGNPSDYLQVDICEDNAGAPGESLCMGQLAGSQLTTTLTWSCFELMTSGPVLSLSAGQYWLQVHRSSDVANGNHFRLKVDELQSYAGGECWLTDGPRPVPCDLLFRICGGMETTDQIKDMANSDPFLAGVRIDAASGVQTNPFRTGSLTALQEIIAHLNAGNSAGVQMAAEVTSDRYLQVYLQPDPTAATLYINSAGLIVDQGGKLIPPWMPTAGRWAIVSGAWGELGSAFQQIRDRVLLEAVEYDPISGGLLAAQKQP